MNAAVVTASDDPLFSPTKSSQSTRTSTPVPNDPLSRPSSNSPLDSSNSTPVSPRRTNTSIKTNGSIFGDIDVSKLGGSTHSKRVSSASLRSSTALRSDSFDEDDLFGGGKRASRTRLPSKATTPPQKSPLPSNQVIETPIDPVEPKRTVTPTQVALPVKPSTPPAPPMKKSSPPPPVEDTSEEKQPSSFFASASRFFKSSNNNTPSKTSSSASSIASAHAPLEEPVQLPPPIKQQQQASPPPPMKQTQLPPPSAQIIPPQEIEEEDEEEISVIEDEATRAFADDVITFQPTAHYTPDYASLGPDLDSLHITLDTSPNRKLMIPSISTPTSTGAEVDDPWLDGFTKPLLGPIEPSASSPIQPQHRISVQDIEPQKRSAFADLISSWNTGQTNPNVMPPQVDPEQFLHHVAEEQRDVGFAGISSVQEEEGIHSRTVSSVWDHEEENPWE